MNPMADVERDLLILDAYDLCSWIAGRCVMGDADQRDLEILVERLQRASAEIIAARACERDSGILFMPPTNTTMADLHEIAGNDMALLDALVAEMAKPLYGGG